VVNKRGGQDREMSELITGVCYGDT